MTVPTLNASRKTKKTVIGELPVDWGVASLRNICTLMTNGFVGTSTVHYAKAGIPYLMANNVRANKLDTTSLTFITREFHEQNKRTHLQIGDILTIQTGFIGVSCLVPKEYKGANAHALIISRVDQNKADPAFICNYINSDTGQKGVWQIQTAGGRPHLNTGDFAHFHVPLPPLPEQRRIAAVLGTWDRAIEQQDQLLATKRQFKHGVMQQLLTGKRRFRGYEQPWRTCHLGHVFKQRNEINRPDLPLLAITSDRGVIHRDQLGRTDTSSEDKRLYLRIAPGDIGYNTMRMWQGVSAVSEFEGIVSPAYTICIPQDGIDPHFAGCLFKSPPIVHLFHRYSQGLVKDTLNLKFHEFAEIRIELPPIEEQKMIADVFRTLDREISLLEREGELLRDQKRGLMQKLLTGMVRVRG